MRAERSVVEPDLACLVAGPLTRSQQVVLFGTVPLLTLSGSHAY